MIVAIEKILNGDDGSGIIVMLPMITIIMKTYMATMVEAILVVVVKNMLIICKNIESKNFLVPYFFNNDEVIFKIKHKIKTTKLFFYVGSHDLIFKN